MAFEYLIPFTSFDYWLVDSGQEMEGNAPPNKKNIPWYMDLYSIRYQSLPIQLTPLFFPKGRLQAFFDLFGRLLWRASQSHRRPEATGVAGGTIHDTEVCLES